MHGNKKKKQTSNPEEPTHRGHRTPGYFGETREQGISKRIWTKKFARFGDLTEEGESGTKFHSLEQSLEKCVRGRGGKKNLNSGGKGAGSRKSFGKGRAGTAIKKRGRLGGKR